jgi:hypothetical protein
MDDFDLRLRQRLEGLERAAPVSNRAIERRRPKDRATRTILALAAALALAVLSGGVAGAALVVYGTPQGHEGFENPGQPFYGAGLRCMSPPDAHRVIAERGYTARWQIEDRDEDGIGTTSFADDPPPAGVVEGGYVDGSVAFVVVSVGSGTRPYAGCESDRPTSAP